MSYQIKTSEPPLYKMGRNTTNKPPITCPDSDVQGRGLLRRVHDWTRTTPAIWKIRVAISSNILALLLSSISLIFLNYAIFASERISTLYTFLSHLKPSPRKKSSRNFRPHLPQYAPKGVNHRLYVESTRYLTTHARDNH